MMRFLKANNVPILYLGPYQFLAAGIELVWGWLKSVEFNPDGIKTGKRKWFKDVK